MERGAGYRRSLTLKVSGHSTDTPQDIARTQQNTVPAQAGQFTHPNSSPYVRPPHTPNLVSLASCQFVQRRKRERDRERERDKHGRQSVNFIAPAQEREHSLEGVRAEDDLRALFHCRFVQPCKTSSAHRHSELWCNMSPPPPRSAAQAGRRTPSETSPARSPISRSSYQKTFLQKFHHSCRPPELRTGSLRNGSSTLLRICCKIQNPRRGR